MYLRLHSFPRFSSVLSCLLAGFFATIASPSMMAVEVPSAPAVKESKWEREIAAIEAQEAERPVPANGILFTGSSSIRLWRTLAQDLAGYPVYNRGFGGSQISDLIEHFDRVVTPGSPKRIVIYSGTNDLHSGKSPASALQDLQVLVEKIEKALPGTEIAIISVAPNPSRWAQREQQQQFNAMAAAFCAKHGHDFIDVWTPMLGEDGTPSRPLYVEDNLHMNAAGYALWTEIVGDYLKRGVAP